MHALQGRSQDFRYDGPSAHAQQGYTVVCVSVSVCYRSICFTAELDCVNV